MQPFASVEQYEARFGAVSDAATLSECLSDATAAICAALDLRGIDYTNPSESFADRLMRACRSVANRLMPSDGDQIMQGVTQMSMTAGSYNQQYTFQSSYGTPKLLPSELELLGIGGGRAGWVPLTGGRDA